MHRTWLGFGLSFFILSVLIVYASMKAIKVRSYGDTKIYESKRDSFFDEEFIWSSDDEMQFAFGLTAYDNI